MPRGEQADLVAAEHGSHARVPLRERGRRAEGVGARERVLQRCERRRVRADVRRQLRAHAPLLRLLGLRREEEAIVELDGEQRLDEDRLVGLRAVLHHALEGPCGRGADGHDVAAVADRHVLLADHAGVRRLAHDLQELRFETRAQLARRPARGGERRAGVLAHLTAVVEQRGERGLDLGRLRQAVGDAGEQREAVGIAPQVHAHAACHEQQVAHLEQPPRLERRAGRRGLRERRRETRHVRRGQRSGLGGQRDQLRRACRAAARLRRARRRAGGPAPRRGRPRSAPAWRSPPERAAARGCRDREIAPAAILAPRGATGKPGAGRNLTLRATTS